MRAKREKKSKKDFYKKKPGWIDHHHWPAVFLHLRSSRRGVLSQQKKMFPNHNIDFSSRITKKYILMKLIKEMIRYVPCHGTTNTREIKQEDRRTIAFLRKRRWLKRNRCWITSLMSVWGSIMRQTSQKLRHRVGKKFPLILSSLKKVLINLPNFLPALEPTRRFNQAERFMVIGSFHYR